MKSWNAILAFTIALAPYVGQTIRVHGAVVNGAINAQNIEVNQDGKWQPIKLEAMM